MTEGLEARGRTILGAFGAATLDSGAKALVVELARCADTLDRLNDLAVGRRESWAELTFDDMGEVHLHVDKILDEQRKTQTVFRALYAELRQAGVKPSTVVSTPEITQPEDLLARRRREKAERESKFG